LPDCQILHPAHRAQSPNPITRLPNYPITRFVVALSLSLLAGCSEQAKPAGESLVVWRPLGKWSGPGFVQTEPFIGDTGSIRLTWETRNEGPAGTGTFKVTLHSDVSGRPLLVAIDRKGVGRETTYVTEDPRAFFLVIEGHNLDWTLTAEEGLPATAAPPAKR
jgi:hypothetical protein